MLHLAGRERRCDVVLPDGPWEVRLDASDEAWGGPGAGEARRAAVTGGGELVLPPWAFLLLGRGAE